VKTRSIIAGAYVTVCGAAYAGHLAGATTLGQDPPGMAPYQENCKKCHGVRGVAPKTMKAKYPKIATFDSAFFAKRTDDSVVTILTKGKNDDMKSFKDKLSHDQMVAVAAYIRSFAAKP
jgi:mono/diheme cytochrome c family protein